MERLYGCKSKQSCNSHQLPGTLIRINIPEGAEINVLNLLEVSSPSGICLILRIPVLGRVSGLNLNGLTDTIRQAGGTVEFL